MAKSVEYRGFTIANPNGGFSSWRCTFSEHGQPRTRFGTLDELKADCDLVADGIGLPPREQGPHGTF